jgi:hypothetical protein
MRCSGFKGPVVTNWRIVVNRTLRRFTGYGAGARNAALKSVNAADCH